MGEIQLHRKVIGVPLQKAISKSEDGFLLVRGKFTSDQRDEVGDIITRAATEKATARFRQWGNIRYMHQDRPVGRVCRMGMDDGLDWNEVEMKIIDPQAAFEVENGLLQALSIGALVNLEDVQLMADGGWLINDYSLAEISLVDHPANYDARLMLSLDLDEAVRSQAREIGIVPVLRSLGIHVKETKQMSDAAEEIAAALQPVQALDHPVAEETAAVEEPVVEEPVAEQVPVVEEPVAEEPEVEVEEQPVTVVETSAQPTVEKSIDAVAIYNALSTLTSAVATLAEQVKAMKAEAQVAPEQPISEPEKKSVEPAELEELRQKNAALEAQIAELSRPVDRKGMLPAEELPTPETETPAEEEVLPKDLRSALTRFIQTRH